MGRLVRKARGSAALDSQIRPGSNQHSRQLGVTGTMAMRHASMTQWARVRVETTPPQPGVTFGSWLTTVGGEPGLAMRPGDTVGLP